MDRVHIRDGRSAAHVLCDDLPVQDVEQESQGDARGDGWIYSEVGRVLTYSVRTAFASCPSGVML